jgi:hypothetical protein
VAPVGVPANFGGERLGADGLAQAVARQADEQVGRSVAGRVTGRQIDVEASDVDHFLLDAAAFMACLALRRSQDHLAIDEEEIVEAKHPPFFVAQVRRWVRRLWGGRVSRLGGAGQV